MDPLLLFQLADSAFPTGGFAHSQGLEAAAQLGEVRGPDALERHVRAALWNAGASALPYVGAAHRDPGALAALDLRFDAFTTCHVANRASRAQGRAFVRACAAAFGGGAAEVAERVRCEALPGHLPPALGAVTATLSASKGDAALLFLFWTLRGLLSAAVRLGLAGPLEAQAMQARLAGEVAEVADACGGRAVEDAAASSPLLVLFQAHQDRLYCRLFQS